MVWEVFVSFNLLPFQSLELNVMFTLHRFLLYSAFGLHTFHFMYLLKGEFEVVLTDKLYGWSLSSKIPVDMNSIFMKLYVT